MDSITKRYFTGVLGIAKYALGIMTAPDYIIEERRIICDNCSYKTVANNKNLGGLTSRCKECRCWILPKTSLKDEKCPLKPPRWNTFS